MTLTEPSAKILVVDDDPDVRDIVERCLVDAGYKVWTCGEGAMVLGVIQEQGIDLAIVDLVLPDTDGLALTRSLKEHSNIGVIILSGRGETTEKIIGLEIGADDYLAKPFEPRELLARVRSVLRRLVQTPSASPAAESMIFSFEGWNLDITARTLTSPKGEPVELSSGEFNLLKAFVEHPNRVLSRDQLLDFTHANDSPAFDRSVDVRVGRVRKKIEVDPQNPQFIKTIRNGGYMFAASVNQS
ncbi:MAG: response regulator [Rhodospirillales bacterium]|nr:response regulator [Alphaproteobacteria bacterium]MBL6947375.1 response regulator [Rhodospirillales bacterium]